MYNISYRLISLYVLNIFCLGSKRKRNHPNKLNGFALFTNASAQNETEDKYILKLMFIGDKQL